ncbi:MAG: DUF1499 domain-containing protein [Pseudomonadota bacterium]
MKWLLLVPLIPLLLVIGALIANRPPLLDPPGPLQRLRLYFTTHVAETRVDHERPELRPIWLGMDEKQALSEIASAMDRLHWQDVRQQDGVVRALVVTPLLGFKDDIEVWLEPTGEGTLLQARSVSRIGRGDLAANTRHILELFQLLSVPPKPSL